TILGKELNEPTVATLEVLAAHTSWSLPYSLFYYHPLATLPKTSGPVAVAETQLRRRALHAFLALRHRDNNFLDVRNNTGKMGEFLSTLCALGWEPPAELLLAAAPPATEQGRMAIHTCVERTAAAGEATVVVHLLAILMAAAQNAFPNYLRPMRPQLMERVLLDAIEVALDSAVRYNRVAVAAQVLEDGGPAKTLLSDCELAGVIRACQLRNTLAPLTSPATSQNLREELARLR
ncbi:hypothetical protein HK405_014118, partial [Cladochytrium tenue]